MMRGVKTSITLKTLCYILIPIFLLTFLANVVVGVVLAKEPDIFKSEDIYSTEEFSNIYYSELYSLYNQLEEIIRNEETQNIIGEQDYYNYFHYDEYVNDNNEKIIYNVSNYDIDFDYVVVDKNSNTVYTNLAVTSNKNTAESLIQHVKNESVAYWNFSNGNVESNIENLKKENISYSNIIYEWMENNSEYDVYTTLNNSSGIRGNFWELETLYNIMKPIAEGPYQVNIILSLIFLVVCITYLISSLGYKKDYKGIYLNWLDKIPLEIIIVAFIFGLFMVAWIVDSFTGHVSLAYNVVGIVSAVSVLYIAVAIALSTIIKRIKAKVFIKNTLIYKIIMWTRKLTKEIFKNTKLIVKLSVLYGGFVFIFFIVMLMSASYYDIGFPMFLLFILLIFVYIKLYDYTKNLYKIKMAIKKIYEGNNEIILNPDEMKGELRDVAVYVNDIAGGLSNAIEESIKSERFKTELITNVSHDIKTPLTSIINYVDLLKQENVDNEKIKEYIQILDQKSQRLKKLTEDLVEASKASSGNVKLEMEKINIVELIKQATGEFEDKFNEKGLKIVTEIPESEVNILADNRYIYRVIENLFSNISKYALEGSRVYIDVIAENKKVKIVIKNISKESLNITAEELMQRFVRGDKSRTTEGSGLGLSISKSLTELQKGTFDIQVDGDLFKVEIAFDLV